MQKDIAKELFLSKKALLVVIFLALAALAAGFLFQMNGEEGKMPDRVTMENPGSSQTEAETIRWTGNAKDGKWSTAQNWDLDLIPGENSEVIFDSGAQNNVTVDQDFSGKIGALRIKGFTGKITQVSALEIAGDYYQDSGSFTTMGELNIKGDFSQIDGSVFEAAFGDTYLGGEVEIADGFEIRGNDGAVVYIKSKDSWKTLTLSEAGSKEYYAQKMTDSAVDTWIFNNNTSGLKSYTSQEKGWSLTNSDNRWEFRYLFGGIERSGQEVMTAKNAGISAEADRISLDRGSGVEEWYMNKFRGIEQGFTIKDRPQGEGELELKGEVKLDKLTLKESTEDLLIFAWEEYDVLEYGELSAIDAKNKKIPAKMKFDKTSENVYDLTIVVDDTDAIYPIVIDPISTDPSWTGLINIASAGYGKVATPAGDVNGDGRDDFLVTAETYDGPEDAEGKAFLYYGSNSGVSTTPAWSYESNYPVAYFGHSASGVGDVNNDGFDDVMIGANGYDTEKGKLYLFLGGSTGLSTTPDWTYLGQQTKQDLGEFISDAGDVNGDGYDDVIVGAHYYDKVPGTITNSGRAFLFLGNSTGLETSPSWTYEGSECNEYLGFKVSTAGDVNKDGFADVLVGSPQYGVLNEGAAFLFHGSATGLAAAPVKTFTTSATNAFFGNPVAAGGDINKDGWPDILIGASRYDGTQSNKGAVFAYYGSVSGFLSTPSWQAIGEEISNGYFGSAWYLAGDVNGDGYDDAIAGSCGYNAFEGKAFVYEGSSTGLKSTPIWTKTGGMTGSYMGWFADTAGDVNGDGASDFLVSAYKYDNASTGGRAWLFSGVASATSTPEICFGGVDEDLDGLIDLADPNCDASVDKANISINVSTSEQDDWYDDTCNQDTDSDGYKEYDKNNLAPACEVVGAPDKDLYYYQVCDSDLSSYDSVAAKSSYINEPFIGDEDYAPCSRDGVHDDYHATDAISPLMVQPAEKDFTIAVSASDAFGISSIKIEWTNTTTYSITDADWHNASSDSITCTDSATCNVCVKGGDCGEGHDLIDYASLGIPDGLKQQKFFFRVTVVDNASPTPHSITTGYDDNTAVAPVLDKYYRLVICSQDCHTCVNKAPVVSLDRYEAPTDFCSGLGYKLYWNFSDVLAVGQTVPDTQAYYELQVRERGTTEPTLTAMRTSSDTYAWLSNDYLDNGNLQYNKTYEWRVKAYDSSTEEGCQASSVWTPWSPYDPANPAASLAFTTPNHQYPVVSFTMTNNSDVPAKDCADDTCGFLENIQFIDSSAVYVAGTPTYKWYVTDMATPVSTINPFTRSFPESATTTYDVRLTVTDGAGAPYTCSATRQLILSKKNPVWNEVAPIQD